MASHNCESSYVFEVQYFVKKMYDTEYIDMVYIQNEFEYVFEGHNFLKKKYHTENIYMVYIQNEIGCVFED